MKEVKFPYLKTEEGQANILASLKKLFTGSLFTGKMKADNVFAGRLYDAVVDIEGNGDFTDIQSALDAGEKRLFVRNGTYVLDRNITLLDDIVIVGESKYDTIIDCNNTAYKIQASGSNRCGGSGLSVTNNSTTVTDAGAVFQSNNVVAGDFIFVDGGLYEISSVDSQTQLTLKGSWEGLTSSGLSYRILNPIRNVRLSNFTITNFTQEYYGSIHFLYVVESQIVDVISELHDGESNGIELNACYNCLLNSLYFRDSGTIALNINSSDHITISDILISNCKTFGLILDNADSCELSNISAVNSATGISISGYGNKMVNARVYNSKNYGIVIIGGYNSVSNFYIQNIGKDGVRITNGGAGATGSGVGNRITNGIIIDCSQTTDDTYSGILLDGDAVLGYLTYNYIAGVYINATATNKMKYGIREDTASEDYNLIIGNQIRNAQTAKISTQGANTEVSHNV